VTTMRIGVLADTHVPNGSPALPPRALEIFRGVDIILHAGDICTLSVLQQLEPIAQTFAVAGEQDSPELRKFLQEKQRLEFAKRAIGLVHGHRAWERDWLTRATLHLSATRRAQMLYAAVLREFADVDAIVFGHSHAPYIKMHGSVLLFNPGSAMPDAGRPGTVGMLEIGTHAMKGRIIAL